MLLEEPVVVLDERATHAPLLLEGVLEHHLDHETQKRIAVHNLNKISFVILPDGKSAVSTEEIKSPAHEQILEESLKTLLGERIDNTPYLTTAEGIFGSFGNNFAQINAPAHIKILAESGVKDFADALNISHSTHAARVR